MNEAKLFAEDLTVALRKSIPLFRWRGSDFYTCEVIDAVKQNPCYVPVVVGIDMAMGITRAGVSWRGHSMGLRSRHEGRPREADPDLLTEMWNAKVSTREISDHFGYKHQAAVANVARQLGLPKRVRGAAGYRNGGWPANLPIKEFWARRSELRGDVDRLAAKMAEVAVAENQAHQKVVRGQRR